MRGVLKIDPTYCTVCFSTCDTFDQPIRSTKFHQLLVIYDSFCSWMATNLIHNCNFDHNSEGWQWEPLHLRCQNSTILTFYPDLANLRHLNSDFFQIRHCSVINEENFESFEMMNTQKSHKLSKRNQNSMENQFFWVNALEKCQNF